ncbi:TetR/AcrR family transcriptional regulator [Geothrix terrae]|uniref:TetR/AcrR family transcriptional regulator n=1 Tax=Geothrix terrae TaxID=2922720 RepID=UPI001FACF58E|nr:TetR/AcrR family transcriptional regulator [Geothrix terrae]
MVSERSNREGILLTLLEEFRGCGFDGVSLSRISEVTGLGKASLYHHFPGGKGEMAEAVMDLAASWLEGHVFGPLEGGADPATRLATVLDALEGFYAGGSKSCLLDVMPLTGGTAVRAAVKAILQRLLAGFEQLALDGGLPAGTARARAEAALVSLQGSLVLARGLGETGPFMRALQALREGFLGRA